MQEFSQFSTGILFLSSALCLPVLTICVVCVTVQAYCAKR